PHGRNDYDSKPRYQYPAGKPPAFLRFSRHKSCFQCQIKSASHRLPPKKKGRALPLNLSWQSHFQLTLSVSSFLLNGIPFSAKPEQRRPKKATLFHMLIPAAPQTHPKLSIFLGK